MMIDVNAPETLLLAALVIPLLAAVLIPLFHRTPNLRETVTLISAGALAWTVWSLAPHVVAGARPFVHLITVAPGLDLAFRIEPLGMLFALVSGTLWIVNSIYSIGYMRGHHEPRQTSFYVCFAIAISSAIGIAFSANLFTLFVCYEALTLSTYPLVTHKADEEAMKAGRVYLLLLLGTSMVFLLPAIIATAVLAGTVDFAPGGILADKATPTVLAFLLALYAFGIGKAALMPFHRWLPSAMVAPTPVSALLHAVAVVKAGVFTIVKVVVYVFGIETLAKTGASEWLTVVACVTLLLASAIAMTKDNLKARLAYSTVSQLSYVVLGASLAVSAGIIGASLQIAMHAVGKITLFFCAGAIYVAAHKTEISELTGLGRKMPFTFAAFLVGSLSIIGLPPFGGSWSKWWLLLGALDAGQMAVVVVLILSSLLNVLYLLPIVFQAFFVPAPRLASAGAAAAELPDGLERRYWLLVLPPCLTAIGCLILFLYVDRIVELIKPIATP
ncbi:MAG: monovalent cation/H+ antiporter subunit D family protein [Hyphomicrobiaceae bacterium]